LALIASSLSPKTESCDPRPSFGYIKTKALLKNAAQITPIFEVLISEAPYING